MQPEEFTLPVEAKPLFRPDVLRSHLDAFSLPERVETLRGQLADWAELLGTARANRFKEQELLPDFVTLYFHGVLGYLGPADNPQRYTISRERHVEVDGKFADAVLGEFNGAPRTVPTQPKPEECPAGTAENSPRLKPLSLPTTLPTEHESASRVVYDPFPRKRY